MCPYCKQLQIEGDNPKGDIDPDIEFGFWVWREICFYIRWDWSIVVHQIEYMKLVEDRHEGLDLEAAVKCRVWNLSIEDCKQDRKNR